MMVADQAVNIADSLGRWAEETPFRVAIIETSRVIHYRDLDAAVWRVAAWLAAEGVKPGDRVGISLAGNSAGYLIVVYGLARIGAVTMQLPLAEPPAVRLALARRFALAAVVGDDGAARLDGFPLLTPIPVPPDASPAPIDPRVRAPGGAAPWLLCLSSGTTGAPKAMERSHRDHIRLCAIGHRQAGNEPGDRFLALIGFHLPYGLYHPMLTLAGGGTVSIPSLPIAVPDLAAMIDREDITRLALTPNLLDELLPHFAGGAPRFPGIRRLSIATMFTPERLRREIRRRITPNLVIVYGTNEALYVTTADAAAQIAYPETAGFPFEGVDIEIVGDQGEALPRSETGIVRLRGTPSPAGYVDDPQATARAFRDGWYYPGDLGLLSPEGALFLKGRADDLINHDGIKIYPADIEAVLLQHPAVAEAAAFPVILDGYRQLPVAAVVLRKAASADSLLAFCRDRLGFRAPRRIHVLPALPRNALGKVLKRELAGRF